MSLGRQPGSWVLMELLSQQTPGAGAAGPAQPSPAGARDAAAHTVEQELLLVAFSVPSLRTEQGQHCLSAGSQLRTPHRDRLQPSPLAHG